MIALDRGPDFEGLRTLIAARQGDMPPVLRRIAEFALDHPNEVALKTVAELAKRARVQPSAMVRFAQALGLAGFSELQRVFRARLTEDRLRFSERLRRMGYPEESGEPVTMLRHFVATGIEALERLEGALTPGLLERAVALLGAAETIYVVGQRRSFAPAAYMSYALGRLDRRTMLLDGVGGMMAEQARGMSPRDVLIAVTFRPYAPDTLSVARTASARGVPIVALTDRPVSPLRPLAAVALEIDEAAVLEFRAMTATMCLAQTLVVSLGRRLLAERAEGGDD